MAFRIVPMQGVQSWEVAVVVKLDRVGFDIGFQFFKIGFHLFHLQVFGDVNSVNQRLQVSIMPNIPSGAMRSLPIFCFSEKLSSKIKFYSE